MENVDYVARAKSLMLRTARTAALVIVPLATISSDAARAATVQVVSLPTGNFVCSVSGDGAPGSCPSGAGASQLAEDSNNILGAKLFTSGAVLFSASGGTSDLSLSTSGTLNGTILSGTVIPLAYDFSLSVSAGSITSWSLIYFLQDEGPSNLGTYGFAVFSGSGSGAGTFSSAPNTGINTTSQASSGDGDFIQAELSVNWTTPGSSLQTLSVTVPVNSFDFNANSRGVPEPASAALFGSGLALLGWRLVRDRKRRFLLRRCL